MNSNNCQNPSTSGTGSNVNNNPINVSADSDRFILRAILNLINQIIEKVAELFSYCARFLMHAEFYNI